MPQTINAFHINIPEMSRESDSIIRSNLGSRNPGVPRTSPRTQRRSSTADEHSCVDRVAV